jgi:hypothetical protein
VKTNHHHNEKIDMTTARVVERAHLSSGRQALLAAHSGNRNPEHPLHQAADILEGSESSEA